MTNFDELVGPEPAGAERDRLQNVHDLLVAAGPPPEITPQIASGPTLAMTLGRTRRVAKSRRTLIALVAAAAVIAVIVGASVSGGVKGHSIALRGTPAAPNAAGRLTVTGKRTMQVEVQGLTRGRYGVYIVEKGRPSLECGSFLVTNPDAETKATLTSPYTLHPHEKWIVTRQVLGKPGVTVMRPSTA